MTYLIEREIEENFITMNIITELKTDFVGINIPIDTNWCKVI